MEIFTKETELPVLNMELVLKNTLILEINIEESLEKENHMDMVIIIIKTEVYIRGIFLMGRNMEEEG